jgi:S1-C subfamily serine protease
VKRAYQTALFLILTIFLAGCAHNNLNHQKKILQRSSFVKIEKVLVVEACTKKKVCTKSRYRSSGSGAVVKSELTGGYVLTAAHVCDDSDVIKDFQTHIPGAKVNTTMKAVTLDGDKYPVEVIDMDFKNDICMLWVDNLFEPPLLVATKPPEPGDRVFNIAAPLGVYDRNMVPIFDGFYDGIDHRGIAFYSLPAFGGSSGSPIVNHRGELIGMVHSTMRFFPQVTLSPNYKALRTFINNSIQKNSYSRIVNVFLNVLFR